MIVPAAGLGPTLEGLRECRKRQTVAAVGHPPRSVMSPAGRSRLSSGSSFVENEFNMASAPTTIMQQKSRGAATRFTIGPDHLDYRFEDRSGTKAERHISWNAVPSRFHLRYAAKPDARRARSIRLGSILVLILGAGSFGRAFIDPLAFCIAYVALLFGLSILLTRHFRPWFSTLRTPEGNIVILGDAQHDAIVDALMRAREAYFRRFAVIDPARSPRWNLRRLRWMLEQEVITEEEFRNAQREILPLVPQPLVKPQPSPSPALAIEQRRFNTLFAFDFQPDHLAFRQRTAVGVEHSFKLRYLNLPEPKAEVEVGSQSQLMPHVIMWSLILAFGFWMEMFRRFPRTSFAGPDCLQHALIVLGPGVVGILAATLAARHLLRIVTTKLPAELMILKDRQHDTILEELRRRRREALQALAEPDPLLTPAEQANLYAGLANLGIMAQSEIPDRMARATALQRHLGLAEPAREPEHPAPGEEQPRQDRPPSHTIH